MKWKDKWKKKKYKNYLRQTFSIQLFLSLSLLSFWFFLPVESFVNSIFSLFFFIFHSKSVWIFLVLLAKVQTSIQAYTHSFYLWVFLRIHDFCFFFIFLYTFYFFIFCITSSVASQTLELDYSINSLYAYKFMSIFT